VGGKQVLPEHTSAIALSFGRCGIVSREQTATKQVLFRQNAHYRFAETKDGICRGFQSFRSRIVLAGP